MTAGVAAQFVRHLLIGTASKRSTFSMKITEFIYRNKFHLIFIMPLSVMVLISRLMFVSLAISIKN